ncbi:15686_t:CDS:2 [Racocetra persica]|uniref:15686_t:CDS:1 n=1 Tax=Racocetra persica TaxID=160502 RepID=A0ACA9L1J8_9GLOM|nr:15686_t:CDS:2 [Racocetra persica]
MVGLSSTFPSIHPGTGTENSIGSSSSEKNFAKAKAMMTVSNNIIIVLRLN